MTAGVVFTVVAVVCSVLALVITLFGTLEPDARDALLFGGLTAYALGRLPWR